MFMFGFERTGTALVADVVGRAIPLRIAFGTLPEPAVRYQIFLTPVLSRRERENRRQSIRRNKPLSRDMRGTVPLLPVGEGPVHGPNAHQKDVEATHVLRDLPSELPRPAFERLL